MRHPTKHESDGCSEAPTKQQRSCKELVPSTAHTDKLQRTCSKYCTHKRSNEHTAPPTCLKGLPLRLCIDCEASRLAGRPPSPALAFNPARGNPVTAAVLCMELDLDIAAEVKPLLAPSRREAVVGKGAWFMVGSFGWQAGW